MQNEPIPDSRTAAGWLSGFLGVVIFSASLPATRVAVLELDPLFLTFARAAIAGLLGLGLLRLRRQPLPQRPDMAPLAIVALGVVLGFPLLTALALREVSSAHAMVFVGLLPLVTALFGVVRGGERPKPAFWPFALGGSLLVGLYALWQGAGAVSLGGDLLMTAAIVLCGLGYAEGAHLARRLGGWQVISWALVLALPLMLPSAVLTAPRSWAGIGWPSLVALAYVSIFSMLVGFVFWYRGLALGGIAAIGQLQLLQPFLGLALAATLLGEPVSPGLLAVAAGVLLCVAGGRRHAVAPTR